MEIDSTFFFFLATPAYFIAILLYLFSSFSKSPEHDDSQSPATLGITASMEQAPSRIAWGRMATFATLLGVLFCTVGVVLRTIELGNSSDWAISVFLPVTNTYETLTFLAWMVPLVYLILERRDRFDGLGAMMAGMAFTLLAIAAAPSIAPRDVSPVVPSLQSYWLVIHVTFMFIGISLFTVGCGASILNLIARKFPGRSGFMQRLEELSYRANAVGFIFYGIGGLIFGSIWADQAWGRYWEFDPKETAMLIAWLSYAVFLHLRIHRGWRDVKVAWASIGAYLIVLYTWIGINYFVSSLHSFTALTKTAI